MPWMWVIRVILSGSWRYSMHEFEPLKKMMSSESITDEETGAAIRSCFGNLDMWPIRMGPWAGWH